MKRYDSMAQRFRVMMPILVMVGTVVAVQFLAAQTPVALQIREGPWVVTDVPNGPWTFRFGRNATTLTGQLLVRNEPTALACVTVSGSTLSFKVLSPDAERLISFEGRVNESEIAFVRTIETLSGGGRGGNDVFGGESPLRFVARRVVTEQLDYKGYKINVTAADATKREEILAGLRGQIDIADEVRVPDATRAFFKTVRLIVLSPLESEEVPSGASYNGGGPGIVSLRGDRAFGANPALLHEFMHAYHDKRVADGFNNIEILKFFIQARESGQFPNDSHFMSNPREFFAMAGSAYLHGKAAASGPFTRENIKKLPDCYRWLEKEFGPG